MTTHVFDFHQDPGHGWVAVPRSLVQKLPLPEPVSQFSYQSRDGAMLFLEEDCDAPLVLQALRDQGDLVKLQDKTTNHDSFVRSLPQYRA